MSARAMASATISFGLVSIPVQLYPAGRPRAGIGFHMLHRKCGSRVRQQFVCPADGEVVPRSETVKGFEVQKGKYVTFTEEELKKLEAVATETIEIAEFVSQEQVDPVHFDRAYWLGPDRGGEKAYRLLCEALRETGRTAIARYAAHGKQYLVMLRPSGKGLAMQELRYASEVRPLEDVPVPDLDPGAAELKLAVQLIEQSASETFDPSKYEDEVKKKTEALIAKKAEGEPIVVEPVAAGAKKPTIDLMEALKASLGQGKPGPAKAEEAGSGEAKEADAPKPVAGGRKAPRRAQPARAKGSRRRGA